MIFSVDFVAPQKGESLLAAYDKYRGWADPKVCCDYGLSVIVNQMSDKIKEEMAELVKNKGAFISLLHKTRNAIHSFSFFF